MKIHPMFHTKKLQKDSDNPLSEQTNSEPSSLEFKNRKTKYKVQEVLTAKLVYSKLKYRV
jgi:hypothetical protein